MDSLIAIKGKDFVIVAADTFNAYSVLKMKVSPFHNPRTTMTRSWISMDKNFLPSEVNTLMLWSSVTTSKKILLILSTKMVSNSQLMTLPTSFDINLPRPSEKDLTQSTVFWQDSKAMSQDCTGSITSDQLSNSRKLLMDTQNSWPAQSWIPLKLRYKFYNEGNHRRARDQHHGQMPQLNEREILNDPEFIHSKDHPKGRN